MLDPIVGTFKGILSSVKLLHSDASDLGGKRKRSLEIVEQAAHERDVQEQESKEEGGRKKQRIRSPTPEAAPAPAHRHQAGYNDPPEVFVSASPAARRRSRQPASHARASSLAIPSTKSQVRRNRHSHSPFISTSQNVLNGMSRTMSMDPPTAYQQPIEEEVYRPPPISRDVSMESAYPPPSSRASPIRPKPTLRSRASITPHPSGQTFGPTPMRRERDPSEPPPLAALMSNPVFVKPPTQVPQAQPLSLQPTLTLGSIAESQPRSQSPIRQHSTLVINRSTSLNNGLTGHGRPLNAAEQALRDLDAYKTPLLPTRLRGSTTIPDMFKSRRLPTPVLMSSGSDDKPRLGKSEKDKKAGKRDGVTKPYAGQGGMKKLLARRRNEEDEEKQQERSAAIEDDSQNETIATAKATQNDISGDPTKRRTVPDLPPVNSRGRETTLRVGRARQPRSHAPPIFRAARNRFSAVYDDDEADDEVAEDNTPEEQVEKPPPMFQPPPGFTFAKDMAVPKSDAASSKEPPLVSLPFSLSSSRDSSGHSSPASVLLGKSGPSSPSSVPVDSKAQAPELPTSGFARTNTKSPAVIPTGAAGPIPDASATAPSTPVLQMLPQIALTPPTPGPAPSASSSSETPPSAPASEKPTIPNFFADSKAFSQPGVSIAPPALNAPLFSKPPSTADNSGKPSLFGNPVPTSTSTSAPSALTWGSTVGEASVAPIGAGTTASSSQDGSTPGSISLSGSAASASAPVNGTALTFGSFAKPAESSPQPFSFGAPQKSTDSAAPAASSTFSLGAPAKQVESDAPISSLPFSFGNATKPASSALAAPPPLSLAAPAEINKHSAAPQDASLTFGAPKTEVKEPERPTTAPEQPKPSLFGGASSVSPFGGFGSSTSNASSEPAKPAFTFGQPSSAPAPSASAPSVTAPKPLFGGNTGGFSFGAPTAPATTEAPAPVKSPFTFGTQSSTPPGTSTEKPALTFGTSTADTSSSSLPTFGAPASGSNGADVSSKPFTFGAPSTPVRPVTPPRNDQEVNMDESPTRGNGMDTNGGGKEALKVTTGFTFGAPSTNSPFGQSTQSASPFQFGGASSGTSNPFGVKTETKPEAPAATGFGGFGQSTSTGFTFGSKAPEPLQTSLSSGPFGQTSATPSLTPTFTFGGSAASGNPFVQPAANQSSTPASPSTFGSAAPFSFGTTPTSATAPSNPFSFNSSQPGSPAIANPGLPSASGTSSTAFSFGQPSTATAQAPASPFVASAPLPGEPALFTIGSASAPAPLGPGNRPLKKLPTRRGGMKR